MTSGKFGDIHSFNEDDNQECVNDVTPFHNYVTLRVAKALTFDL